MLASKENRISTLQGYRAMAFLLIFLSHVEIVSSGVLGVSMFLTLSGFLMSITYFPRIKELKSGVKEYAKFTYKKVRKLIPLHVITFSAMAVFNFLLLYKAGFPREDLKNYIVALPFNLTMLQAWLPKRELYFSFNKVSWYLSVCTFCYFVFTPFFQCIVYKNGINGKTKSKKKAGNVIVALCIVILLIQILLAVIVSEINHKCVETGFIKWLTYICPAFRTGDFFLGILLGLLITINTDKNKLYCRKRKKENLKCNIIYTFLELLWIGLIVFQLTIQNRGLVPDMIRFCVYWTDISLLGIVLFYNSKDCKIGWVGWGGGCISALFRSKPLVVLGNISTQTFLIHQMVIHLCKFVVKNIVVLTFVSLIVTIILSVIWINLEQFVLGLKRNNH